MIRVLHGDCRDVLPTLEAGSVHTCVTSPPYYGLRDYGTALWDGGDAQCDHTKDRLLGVVSSTLEGGKGTTNHQQEVSYRAVCGKCGARRIDRQLGLEATPDEYIQTMVGVFREVRRVLRDDGTCWVNMGDSYASSGISGVQSATSNLSRHGANGFNPKMDGQVFGRAPTPSWAKPKDLLMMPARLALALQADGWWLRSDIIWAKPNPMPESVTDRPTSAHEHVFLLTKQPRYYFDMESIREPSGAAPRNVWTIASHPFPLAHFATFSPALAERCIRAGTSERGCCAQCGAPWVRQVELTPEYAALLASGKAWRDNSGKPDAFTNRQPSDHPQNVPQKHTTIGWTPSCQCDAPTQPCTVLDPFAGAGTACLVADRLQRDSIGIELNEAYAVMARNRIVADAPLFAEVAD